MTGGSINNAIEISRHFNEDRILVCNNDESLKIFTLPTLNLVASLTFPAAVNASAVSPDGSKLVVVGDTNDVFLHGLNSSPGSSMPEYSLIKTLKSCNDSSFSVSWHPSSSIFAIGCQDGFVCLYDIRQLSKKLATLEAHQSNREKKAVRKVMFSPSGSIDLLLFAEVNFFLQARRINNYSSCIIST